MAFSAINIVNIKINTTIVNIQSTFYFIVFFLHIIIFIISFIFLLLIIIPLIFRAYPYHCKQKTYITINFTSTISEYCFFSIGT